MNRRHFLGQVVLGSTVLSTYRAPIGAHQGTGSLTLKFAGMMGYITRSDGSVLVALPGHHPMGHFGHVPFLMARSGSSIATALGMTAMPGVVAGAFDTQLADAPAGAFVFRCLDGVDIEIISNDSDGTVDNQATQLAQMSRIAPGKRLRGDLRRWSPATVSVYGGTLRNSAAHPDAGKIWTFGSHQQALTDATVYQTSAATIRLSAGSQVQSFTTTNVRNTELWVVSAAGPRSDVPDPKRLEHGIILFEYFSNATPVIATCADAEGRITLATEMPCSTGSIVSTAGGFARPAPPFVEMCYGGGWCEPCL